MSRPLLLAILVASNPFAGWPLWAEVAAGVVAGAIALWICLKLFKLALWLLAFAILAAALAAAWHLLGL